MLCRVIGTFLAALVGIVVSTASVLNAQALSAAAPTAVIALGTYSVGTSALTVRATVRGHEGVFLWDTGEGVSMISPAFAQRVGCTPWGQITGYRMTGERIDAPQLDGALGLDVFAGRAITFQLTRKTLTIESPASLAAQFQLDTAKQAPQPVRFTLGGSVRVEGTTRMLDHMAIGENLGATFLRNWDVTLDLASGRAWLTAASRP